MEEQARNSIDNESKELILVGHVFAIIGEAGHIFRPTPNSDWGIDGEIEFKDDQGKASGKRVYLQLKSGDSYLQQRKPVFVYFTADWCLTCKANEVAAIDRDEVKDAFKAAGVKVLVGDWTNGDPAITRFLESRGRAGVPLYLWYAPGREPEELSQVLTPSMLTSRARRAP
jgi:thiol:disulfide interchange protein